MDFVVGESGIVYNKDGIYITGGCAESSTTFKIDDFHIEASNRKKGIGRAAYFELESFLKSQGFSKIVGVIVPHCSTTYEVVELFWRSCGFSITGRQIQKDI